MKYYISTTKFNCGIDLHARQMYVCLMDPTGKKLVHTNIRNNKLARAVYFMLKNKTVFDPQRLAASLARN